MFSLPEMVSYLGHVVTEEGITADPGKVEQVCAWPIPENSTKVKSFLGLASYYRRFIPDFLTRGKDGICLDRAMSAGFRQPEGLLTSGRVLAYPTREGRFVL